MQSCTNTFDSVSGRNLLGIWFHNDCGLFSLVCKANLILSGASLKFIHFSTDTDTHTHTDRHTLFIQVISLYSS